MSYRFTNEEVQKVIWPKRVQILIDDYLAAGRKINRNLRMDYTLETIDYLEKIFEDRVREKPESLKVNVNAVYRVRTNTGQEFYYYTAFKTAENALGTPVDPFSYEYYGYHKRPIVRMQWNEIRSTNEAKVVGYEQAYELPWDKEEVTKLLDSSFIPCMNFYVGRAGNSASEPIEMHRYQIRNKEDFIEGSFEDLIALGYYGISGEYPSLYALEPARLADKENKKREAARRFKEKQDGTNIVT